MNNYNTGAENTLFGVNAENLRKFSKKDVKKATNNFSESLVIGRGAFGAVYKATVDGTVVAVKRMNSADERQFNAELGTLTRFQHENLLSVIGYCDDPKYPSLVLEYMENGSLEARLKDKFKPLPWVVRLKIAYGSALGINHLHTSELTPVVHRDIKSANILLDKNFVPKVADFGFLREGDIGNSRVKFVTCTICYTRYYAAPEVHLGDVSIKQDTFSFGVVLLELLTGKIGSFKGKPLLNYKKSILSRLLDKSAHWDKSVAEKLYNISQRCLIKSKKNRPTISLILKDLRECLSHIPAGGNLANQPPNLYPQNLNANVPSGLGVIQGHLTGAYYWPSAADDEDDDESLEDSEDDESLEDSEDDESSEEVLEDDESSRGYSEDGDHHFNFQQMNFGNSSENSDSSYSGFRAFF